MAQPARKLPLAFALSALLPQRRAVRSFVGRWVRPASEAEDIVQEAYLRLIEAPPRAREPRALLGYLLVIARNLVRDRARREFRERRRAAALAALQGQLDNLAPAVDELAFVEQASEVLRRALAELPLRVRQVFLLHRIQGLRQEDIARRLGVNLRTVERDVSAALAHLKRAVFASEAVASGDSVSAGDEP